MFSRPYYANHVINTWLTMSTCSCSDASRRVENEQLHAESLSICAECGDSVSASVLVDQDEGKTFAADKNKLSRKRREISQTLRGFLLKVGVSWSSPTAAEAKHVLGRVRLQGRGFNVESVAAAVAFVALRNANIQEDVVRLDKTCHVFGVEDVFGANRVLTLLKRDVIVEPRKAPDPHRIIRTTLEEAEFWTSDGAKVDNDAFFARLEDLVDLAQKASSSFLAVDRSFVIAGAFLLYKAELPTRRANFPLRKFAKECKINLRNVQDINSASAKLFKLIKSLVLKLPHVEKAEFMKSRNVVNFVAEIMKRKNLISALLHQDVPKSPPKSVYAKEESQEELDEDLDVDEYLRTDEEVEILRPLHEKRYE